MLKLVRESFDESKKINTLLAETIKRQEAAASQRELRQAAAAKRRELRQEALSTQLSNSLGMLCSILKGLVEPVGPTKKKSSQCRLRWLISSLLHLQLSYGSGLCVTGYSSLLAITQLIGSLYSPWRPSVMP
jgi:hypothetical protein